MSFKRQSKSTEGGAGNSHDKGERPSARLQDRLNLRRAIKGELISLTNLVGRPVLDAAGSRVARVTDVVVRWTDAATHPPVVGVVAQVGRALATISVTEVMLDQSAVRLRSDQATAFKAARQPSDVALAGDVLDHQLVDVTGVQVVRAADVYLARTGSGWELAAIDVGVWALLRRLLPKRRTCPPPDRAIDWADLQAFVPRFADEAPTSEVGPAAAAALSDSSVQMAYPAAELHKLRPGEVADLLTGLDRGGQAQLAALADSPTVAQALADLDPAQRDALLAELDDADRAKLAALQPQGGAQ